MPNALPPVLTGLRAFTLAAALGAMAGCARPGFVRSVSSDPFAAALLSDVRAGALESDESPKVVVRDYPHSPTASVVGWTPGESWQGLRSTLRLDGSLVGDHRLYLSTYSLPDWRTFLRADWHAFSQSNEVPRVLKFTGVLRDEHSCDGPRGCSPYETFTARIPDQFLRASRDSVVVRIRARNGSESLITLRRDLIDSYLAVVDSVSAARHKP